VTDSKPSKTARKREQHELQSLGEKLIDFDDADLRALSLDERLYDAIVDAKRMRSHGALRRQKQLIGKLMRGVDPGPIRIALAERGAQNASSKRLFASAERWRDRILGGEAGAVDAFVSSTGDDSGELERLLNQYRTAANERSQKTAQRSVFRHIHNVLAATRREESSSS